MMLHHHDHQNTSSLSSVRFPHGFIFWLWWTIIIIVVWEISKRDGSVVYAIDPSLQDNNSSFVWNSTIIYTYFEPIPETVRVTGMSDQDDVQLLSFWKEQWSNAGWKPIILGKDDLALLPEYEIFEEILVKELRLDPWCRVLFHRWMAMAMIGGGWYVDYDVFPLLKDSFDSKHPIALPNNGRMTVHDILSPTLASGTGEQWLQTLQVLLEDARAHISPIPDQLTFWTDSLGINNLVKDHGKLTPAPLTSKRVLLPYGRNDPVLSHDPKDCQARTIRNRWVVHVSPKVFQMASQMEPSWRHPRNRRFEAQIWLQHWNQICHFIISQ